MFVLDLLLRNRHIDDGFLLGSILLTSSPLRKPGSSAVPYILCLCA